MFVTDPAGNTTSTTPGDIQVPATNAAGARFAGLTVNGNGNALVSYADGTSEVIGKIALAVFFAGYLAERRELIRLWRENEISDEVMHHLEEMLDYQEAHL